MRSRCFLLFLITVHIAKECWTLDDEETEGAEKHTFCAYVDKEIWKTQQQLQDEAAAEYARHRHESTGDTVEELSTLALGEVLPDNKTIKCNQDDFCYTLWQQDLGNKDVKTILKQGCWSSTGKACFASRCEALTRSPDSLNNTRFCCCSGDMCNGNVTDLYVPGAYVTPSVMATPGYRILPDPNYKIRTIVIAILSVACVAVVISMSYLAYRLWRRNRKPLLQDYLESAAAQLIETPATPTFELDQLKIADLIERGRYGEVWRGSLGDNVEVAIKIFGPHQKQYYMNERDLYMLPIMEHDALPRFYGAEERVGENSMPQYLIVMTYVPMGTLTQFLKENTIDWFTLCSMFLSTASGLAHLHSDITKGDKFKPSIAHRDFNTRNILVKADLSCCICDLGFAMKIQGSRFYRNGTEENAEQSSLTDVGTLRYMAPEVLEGAVNLRDCEASLKQIDVYSLGLVLWEIASRCSDLYQGMPTPTYQLPFQAEIGAHPTFEEMQVLVSRRKERPKFPDVWKDSNPAVRSLKETIDDCWDQDAEARLTSLCVEERVLEMITLWDARHKGVTPTVNPTSSVTEATVLRNATGGDAHAHSQTPLITDALIDPGAARGSQSHRFSNTENSVSTSTTVTELTMSPSGEGADHLMAPPPPPNNNKSNININNAKNNNRVLQPHQGQNPTVERNTHKRSDEELRILGNKLVDKSGRLVNSVLSVSDSGSDYHRNHDDIFDALESSLVQNDSLQQQSSAAAPLNGFGAVGILATGTGGAPQPVNPPPSISYLQNHVNSSEPLIVRPKMPNVPGNGASAPSARTEHNNCDRKSRFPFSNKKHKSDNKNKDKGKGFSFPFFGRKSHGGGNSSNEGADFYPTENLVHNPLPLAQSVLCKPGPSGQGAEGGDPGGAQRRSISRDIQGKCNLDPRPVSTEVRMMNGMPIVRPTSLPVESRGGTSRAGAAPAPPPATAASGIPGYNVDQSALVVEGATGGVDAPYHHAATGMESERHQGPSAAPARAEVGVAKLQRSAHPPGGAQPTVLRVKGKSHSSGDLSPPAQQPNGINAAAAANLNNHSDSSMNNTPGAVETRSHNDIRNHSSNNSSSRSTPSDRAALLPLNNSLEYIQATQSMDRHPRARNAAKPLTASAQLLKNGRATAASLSAGDVTIKSASSPWQPPDAADHDANLDLEKSAANKSAISLQQFDGSLDTAFQPVQDFEC